ncbi:hypothetical protein DESC_270038 [Desulfosarcina cetonica]|nr:hypothetical protein DESC_270038 [Desulfosarcina cetonica]
MDFIKAGINAAGADDSYIPRPMLGKV